MTNARRVLDYLWAIAPDGATNGEIARQLAIRSHQSVYLLTQSLTHQGRLRAARAGPLWIFYAVEEPEAELIARPVGLGRGSTAASFEALARSVLERHYAAEFSPGSFPGVRKQFDFVSPDRLTVGEALYYPSADGLELPPAKFSIVAEHVWLMEKTGAPTRFLVFGNDREVPMLWLERYETLASSVAFYFLSASGELELLAAHQRQISTVR
jgi:hypothetical protein